MLLGDGDGFVRCACGHWHWGTYGAAGLLVLDPEHGVLLQRRAWWTHHGRTWALPGGAVRSDETPAEAATREANEEADVAPEALRLVSASTEEHETWRYTTVLAHALPELRTRAVSSESAELRWVDPAGVRRLPLHRDFATAWPALAGQLGRALVLVVDAVAVLGGSVDRAAGVFLRDGLAELARSPLGAAELGQDHRGQRWNTWSWWARPVLLLPEQAGHVDSSETVEVVSGTGEDEAISVTARRIGQRYGTDHVVLATEASGTPARSDTDGVVVSAPENLRKLLESTTAGAARRSVRPVRRRPNRNPPAGPA